MLKILPINFNVKSSNASCAQKNNFNEYKSDAFLHPNKPPLNKTGKIINFCSIHNKANIKLLDCTLRDGGFINDWHFGQNKILEIFSQLDKAKVDVIEIGYMYNKNNYIPDIDRTRFPSTEAIKTMFKPIKEKQALVSAMVDYGDCDIENIGLKKDGFIDIIRVTFKKEHADDGIKFAKAVKEKGYDVFIQPTSVTSYSEEEMLNLIKKVNVLNPKVMSIVDTYGLLNQNDLKKYFSLLNKNLNENIGIGFHAHDNMELGFSNSMELVHKRTNRKVYLDASLYGMGKSAGNTKTELLSMELDRHYGKKYNIDKMLELIDRIILPLNDKPNAWGYSLPYFISTLNSCHPNYVKFLREKNTPITKMNEILRSLEKDKKLQFDQAYIEELYLKNLRNIDLNA